MSTHHRPLILALFTLSLGGWLAACQAQPTEDVATAQLVQMLASGVVDSTGTPIASGLARFYSVGTTTPATVYSDTAAATPVTQPVTLTAGGTAIVYLTAARRMKVFSADGLTTLIDVNVGTSLAGTNFITSPAFNGGAETTEQAIFDAVSTAWGGSAGFWNYKQSAGATERTPKSWMAESHVSVKDFGALGDGSTDDSTAIQAAIAAVVAGGGGTVYVPPGVYVIATALTITSANVDIQGAGTSATTIRRSGSGNAITKTLAGGTVDNSRISTITISHATTSTGVAVALSGSSNARLTLDRVSIGTGFRNATTVSAGTINILDASLVANPADASAIALDITSGGGANIVGSSIGITGSTAIGGIHHAGGAPLNITNSSILSSGYGVSLAAGGTCLVSSSVITGSSVGVTIANGTSTVFQASRDSQISSITDARVGLPIVVSLSTNSSVGPAPLTSEVLKVIATAAITVSVAAAGASEWGRKFSMHCVNASGGSVTWSFDSSYKLTGSVAPTTGNRVVLLLENDPQDGTTHELSRATTAN